MLSQVSFQGKSEAVGLAMPTDAITGQPNCGLTAMAIATGQNLSTVTKWYADAFEAINNRRQGKNWKGRTYGYCRDKALEMNGYKVETKTVRGINLKRWVDQHTKPGQTYIVTTTGHAQAVRDNWVFDQQGGFHIDDAGWRKGKRVKSVTVITKA